MNQDAAGAWPGGIPPDGHRLPEGTGLGPVRLQVSDLERSVAYYGRVLGLEVRDRGSGDAALGAAGDALPLVELLERKGARPVPRRGRLGLFHFAILLPDRAALARFAVHLAEMEVPAGASDHHVSEAFYLNDPDGLGIEVYADRPRTSWRREGRQLVMATDPLDLEDLLGASDGKPWSGMPGEAVIGHVHLHVGDLSEAEAFYHRGLGLDKTVWSYPGALFLSAGGYHHHLGLNTWAAGARPPGIADARLLEWRILVPSAGAVQDALRNLAEQEHAVEEDAAGGSVRDPWGTRLRLVGA